MSTDAALAMQRPETPDYSDNEVLAALENNFTYHPVKDNTQSVRYNEIRSYAKGLARKIGRDCPPSRERSLALTKLEEAVMWANAAIARNE
jgi:hypothetical protein